MSSSLAKKQILTGIFFLATAVMLGAFGAHGLKQTLLPKYLSTFKTGITYQFYHGFALIILGIITQQFSALKTSASFYTFTLGILLFCFNCYLYAITQIKFFALIVPVGGILFISGWSMLFYQVARKQK
ncbi:MAG: DUF423 domain-containing protein [Halobacteriovoraceae bacterium]|jgi:uncharacterized membrane protein YgdD (TMEM256/DUF423 family)|nr:DUF423 domain-containing protein [Halobacteriovoraceae bacterium]